MTTTKPTQAVTIPLEVARLVCKAFVCLNGSEPDDESWSALRALRRVGSKELAVAAEEILFSIVNVDFTLGGDDQCVHIAKSGLGVYVKAMQLELDAMDGFPIRTVEDTDTIIADFNDRCDELVEACQKFQPQFLRLRLKGYKFFRGPYSTAFVHKFLGSVRKLLSLSFQSVTSVVICVDPKLSPHFLYGLEPYLDDRLVDLTLRWQDGNGPREKILSRPRRRAAPTVIMPAGMSRVRSLQVDGAYPDESDPFPGQVDSRTWLPPKLLAASLDEGRYPCLVSLVLSNLDLRRACLPDLLANCAGTLRELALIRVDQRSFEWIDTLDAISTSCLTTLFLKGPLCIKRRHFARAGSRSGSLKQIILQEFECYRETLTDLLVANPSLTDLRCDSVVLHQHPNRTGQPHQEWSVLFEHIQTHCSGFEKISLHDARDKSGPILGGDGIQKALQLARQSNNQLLDPRLERCFWQLALNADVYAFHSLGSLLRSMLIRTGSLKPFKVRFAPHIVSLAPSADVRNGTTAQFEPRFTLARSAKKGKMFVIPLTPVPKAALSI